MVGAIGVDGSTWVVANPVQPAENFADKWRQHPERAQRFLAWSEALKRDLDDAARTESKGLDILAEQLIRSFGEEPIQKSMAGVAANFKDARVRNSLSLAVPSGTLATIPIGKPVRDHTFHGRA